jgi:hypothetical protein
MEERNKNENKGEKEKFTNRSIWRENEADHVSGN